MLNPDLQVFVQLSPENKLFFCGSVKLKIKLMKQEPFTAGNSERGDENTEAREKPSNLTQKVNVDQQAIAEAREAVGDDEEKIREYLINNRGL